MYRDKTPLSLCRNSQVKFGTSGVRGPVSELTQERCGAFIEAFLKELCQTSNIVCIGQDLRPSSPMIKQWISECARQFGYTVWDCGSLATPSLAHYSMAHQVPAIMVTGSHIPFDRNGIKFYLPGGEISKQDESRILNAQLNTCFRVSSDTTIEDHHDLALAFYRKRYQHAFTALDLSGKRVGVYQHSSVIRDQLTMILKAFGAKVIPLGRTNAFVALDTEAVSKEDQIQANQWSREYNLDAIVSTDGDGDRPLIADEKGQWLRGDQVGMICCQYLKANHIVTPINSNTGLEALLPKATVIRTKIGSPYVLAAMETAKPSEISVGYEANGGVLLGSHAEGLTALPTRDAVLPILIILAHISHQPLSSVISALSKRHTSSERLQDITVSESQSIVEYLSDTQHWPPLLSKIYTDETVSISALDTQDGARVWLSNNDILHIRASGNANELRIYVESSDSIYSEILCAHTKQAISSLFFDI
ncbi:phosphomannomutase [Marinomonas ostreistagni]|uniref:Phosphomannomutase n=1 Tax=Marinomonas ostreistagni TaxID=359209 RepID=A0ABS0ZCY3_9GAMM|nr:phosphomannomutase [Marinomonas ostreistagni]MBJ7551532.1 phosphomannomutase [Marinomonas ostreistagni]